MTTTRSACILALAISIFGILAAQHAHGQSRQAEVPSALTMEHITAVTGAKRTPLLLPIRCDESGNYYARQFEGSNPQKSPIREFGPNGEAKASFFPSDPEFDSRGSGIVDFAVSKTGDVYALIVAEKGNYIIGFKQDGTVKSKVKLGVDFNALRFDIFDSGDFLVSGVDRESSVNLAPHSPYTAIFGANGSLIKKLTFAEDKQYEEAAKRGDSDFFDSTLPGGGNFAVERGRVVRGSDNNIYVVRWTSPTKVYVVSQTGDLLRSFDVDPGLDRKKPDGVHEHGGRLALQYPAEQDDPRSIIKVVAASGDEASYDSKDVGVAFACYSEPDKFTFFTANSKNMEIMTMVGQKQKR